jgi:hypothetical protein
VRITLLGAVLGGAFGVIGSDLSAFALGLATADAMIGAFVGWVVAKFLPSEKSD